MSHYSERARRGEVIKIPDNSKINRRSFFFLAHLSTANIYEELGKPCFDIMFIGNSGMIKGQNSEGKITTDVCSGGRENQAKMGDIVQHIF